MSQFVLALTGPPGAGKTSVGSQVAKRLARCAALDADAVKHMIVSGFYTDASMPEGGGFTEWELLGDSIGVLAANFADKGCDVVISGYIDEAAWAKIEAHISITHRILLLPELDMVIARDSRRPTETTMGEASVRKHYDVFMTKSFYRGFQRLDTTKQQLEESASHVLALLERDGDQP